MPPGMQAKLLTVLEENVIRRIGGERWLPVDVRFVAATNKRTGTLVQEQSLREDLYYRLAFHKFHLPPLRGRPDDIPGLIDYALTDFNRQSEVHCSFHPDLVAWLQARSFPGNVRELKNVSGGSLSSWAELGTRLRCRCCLPSFFRRWNLQVSRRLRRTSRVDARPLDFQGAAAITGTLPTVSWRHHCDGKGLGRASDDGRPPAERLRRCLYT